MAVSRASVLAILVGCSCSTAAFNYLPRLPGEARARSPYSRRGSCTGGLYARLPLHESLDASGDRSESVTSSRRSVLQHCASIVVTTAFAWRKGRDAANALELSSGLFDEPPRRPIISSEDPAVLSGEAASLSISPQVEQQVQAPKLGTQDVQQEVRQESSPRDLLQYASEFFPRELEPYLPPSPSSATQVTLENSQVVTIPTTQVPVANSNQSSIAASTSESTAIKSATAYPAPKQPNNGIALAVELSITTTVLGAVGKAVYGQMSSNTDELTAIAKVVLIENEPYGLAKGRRYYNGIDITRNEPIPASDVLKYCDAGLVNNDCAELITDFLGEVQSNANRGLEGPSMHQKETASAVLSYLDTLSSSNSLSKTSAAFLSYLNGLSNGEIDAPASPQVVAGYLESLNEVQQGLIPLESNSKQIQGDMTRFIETLLISNDGFDEDENVHGKYEPEDGARMQFERVP